MSLVQMSAAVEDVPAEQKVPRSALARYARPALGIVLPVTLALGWELAVRAGLSDGRLVPPPSRIYEEFADLARTGELARHVLATLLRVAVGFGVGTVVGTLLGAIAGYSTLVRRLVDPSLQGLRAVPSIAWIPLFILWLGIFETSKVALIAVGVFSLLLWRWTGDLRLYGWVQFFPCLVLPLLFLLFPAKYSGTSYWLVAAALYALAKLFEFYDAEIYSAGSILSGHTLKHFAAASACVAVLRHFEIRRPIIPE